MRASTGDDVAMADDAEMLFWELAELLQAADPRVAEGTIMSSRCLRLDGDFLAMVDTRAGHLVVKLSAERVSELVDAGEGHPFAPAGRVFREWLAVGDPDEGRWRAMLDEAVAFVGG